MASGRAQDWWNLLVLLAQNKVIPACDVAETWACLGWTGNDGRLLGFEGLMQYIGMRTRGSAAGLWYCASGWRRNKKLYPSVRVVGGRHLLCQ